MKAKAAIVLSTTEAKAAVGLNPTDLYVDITRFSKFTNRVPQLKPDTIRRHLDSKFKDKKRAEAGRAGKATQEQLLPNSIGQNIEEDPYADIRKFSKFKDPEELVRFMVQMRDEGF